jgi:hypothetical protein
MSGIVLCIAGIVAWAAAAVPAPAVNAQAAFDRLKALEGTWVATAKDGVAATTRFEIVGGGSVVVEHYSNPAMPGGGHMMTAYHLDGPDLVLTHYCIAKNQPTLRLSEFDESSRTMRFEFVRATNLAAPGAGHMHRAMYRLADPDHFTTEWEYFQDGKRSFSEVETFTRTK